jgi:hypothetical protein
MNAAGENTICVGDLPGCPFCGARPDHIRIETGEHVLQCSGCTSDPWSEDPRWVVTFPWRSFDAAVEEWQLIAEQVEQS